MTARYRYEIQLQDRPLGAFAGPSITGSGGKAIVCVAGSPLRAALTNKDASSLSQSGGLALTAGRVVFYSVEASVDLFIQTGDGYFVRLYAAKPDQLHEIPVDRSHPDQVMTIPFHVTDFPAATETDTGFDVLTTMAMKPVTPIVQVTTVDAAITIDVGTDGSGSNDPDGYIDGVSVAALGLVKASSVNTNTLGALLIEQDSANAGDEYPTVHIDAAAENVTATLLTAADTAAGYIHLPYLVLTRNQPTLS